MKRRKKSSWTRPRKILLGVVIFLVLARIALPYVMLYYANKSLAKIDGYYGHIEDIDVALYRGAYRIDSFYLNKVDAVSKKQEAFIHSKAIDLSLEWKAIFKGKLVGELIFESPALRFTQDRVDLDEVSKDTSDFRKILENFMPVKVNSCAIQNGRLEYFDPGSNPKLDLALTEVNATATNLRNVYDKGETLPSNIDLKAKIYGGTMDLHMKMNPLAKDLTFDLNSKIEKMELPQINDFFKVYANVDVNKGSFNLYTEAATRKGKFSGYVKPLINDLDVVSWKGQDRDDTFWQKLWETLVGGAGQLLKNRNKDQFGTKVEFKGDLDKPDVDVFNALVQVLRNAFVKALRPTIDYEISITTIDVNKPKDEKKGLFKAVFGKKDKE
ncbi:MAG: DUF748 domain-containing protein [Saprospiraceae bacterium]